MTDFGRFIYKVLRYKKRRGVFVAAQAMRRRGAACKARCRFLPASDDLGPRSSRRTCEGSRDFAILLSASSIVTYRGSKRSYSCLTTA